MKTLQLKSKFPRHALLDRPDLYAKDFSDWPSSLRPGEWVKITDKQSVYLAHTNPFAEESPCAHIVNIFDPSLGVQEEEHVVQYLARSLKEAFAYRKCFEHLDSGNRLCYGAADGLPGLTVDAYANCVLAQVGTMGIQRFREEIRNILSKLCGKPVYFVEKAQSSYKEIMPQHAPEPLPEHIHVVENGFEFKLSSAHIQKAGWYYDHRNNRARLERTLRGYRGAKENGLDLFCYMGSWGLHLLRSGVSNVDFVDQGNMQENLQWAYDKNIQGESQRWSFGRGDVFKFLEDAKAKDKRYHIVVSDPPAMAKNIKNKGSALLGYKKLHQKILDVLAPEAFLAMASCTHGVSLEELTRTVEDACLEKGREARLLDLGLQGEDHPFRGLGSRSHYLKYALFFIKEKGL